MALKAMLDSIEGLSDELKGCYIQSDDGKFRLDVEGGFKTTAEVEGLSSALGKERQGHAEAMKALKTFEGIDAKEARDALAKVKAFTADQQKAAEKMQEELAARLAPITAERDKLKADNEALTGKLDAFTIESAIREAKVFEKVEDPIYREHLIGKVRGMMAIKDGKLVGFKASGEQVFDSTGNPASPETLVDGIVNSLPNIQTYFKGSTANGSGTVPGHASPTAPSGPKSFAECRTDAERVAYLSNAGNLKTPH